MRDERNHILNIMLMMFLTIIIAVGFIACGAMLIAAMSTGMNVPLSIACVYFAIILVAVLVACLILISMYRMLKEL